MSSSEAGSNVAEYTVSELSGALKRTVEDTYGYVRVRGEISGYRGPHSSGHAYFAMKDSTAKLEAVVWRGQLSKLKFKPEEGLEVIATGKLTTYPGSSKYQIVIERMEPSGLGALMALLEERRKKFAAEGLFDETRKKKLPRLPLVIGVVTSPTGAVIRDILHRIADRFPVRVLVWPVRVQGDTSAAEVAAAINGFNAAEGSLRPDVLIVARGGGSIEDLWPFNEEIVVRAAAASMIPLVSAIGHETDWTLLDYVADLRAPTPTAAAELILQVRNDLLMQLSQLAARKLRALLQLNERRKQSLRSVLRALPRLDTVLNFPRQRLDHAGEGLTRAAFALYQQKRLKLTRTAQRLSLPMLRQRLSRWTERLGDMQKRMGRAVLVDIKQRHAQFGNISKLLISLSYRNVLARGYVVVRGADGYILGQSDAAMRQPSLTLEFADGLVSAVPEKTKNAPQQKDFFGDARKKG
ncbi:MAG: exodeoxyribonuclease VII large subunit [Pseudomonadota bacterium]